MEVTKDVKKEDGENKKLGEKIENVDEDLDHNSEKSGSPFLSADARLPPSPCLSPGWGLSFIILAPSSVRAAVSGVWWRPWEMGV